MEHQALITNDATVLGLLTLILGLIFYTSKHSKFAGFYRYVPALLLCYFVPALFNSFGVIDGESSKLYFVSSRYLLPACLVLLTLSIDLQSVAKLGSKAIIMFLTGTASIVIGGPLALLSISAINPEWVSGEGANAVWRGMTTIAGSWIGGGANQAAMKDVFEVGNEIFSAMVTVDVLVANVWMAVLLFFAPKAAAIDKKTGADASAIDALKLKVEKFQAENRRYPTLTDLMVIIAISFTATGVAHFGADYLAPFIGENYPSLKSLSLDSTFFWIVVIATTLGVGLSFTKMKNYEGAGASNIGSVMLYILVASIGMNMDVTAIFKKPELFLLGLIWMAFHSGILLLVANLIKAPFFFMAVGSQANVGGAASAPVVAAAFHPSLASVGVLLAVLGYALGTYAAWICGVILQIIAAGV